MADCGPPSMVPKAWIPDQVRDDNPWVTARNRGATGRYKRNTSGSAAWSRAWGFGLLSGAWRKSWA